VLKWVRTAEAVTGAVRPDDLAPPAWQRMREFAWHLPRLLAGLGPLEARGPEDGPPVLVIPGFLAGDRTTMDLRRALCRFGWRAYPWLLGLNTGAKCDTMDLLGERLEALEGPRKVLLVGWSLGGMFARELAHRCPERVRAVATLGSPFSGDLKSNTNVREFYEWIAGHDVYAPPFPPHEGKPPVPTIAFWSRRDGIVAPLAARGLEHEVDKSVEIDTRHMGFALWRPALSRIALEIESFLAEVEGQPPIVRADLSESRH
jgi:pimeloyl-ACP methyl ester carboxylesterase